MNLPHFAPAFTTAFLASSVEAVEAMTVVLAAGLTRGWAAALAGAGGGALVLVAVVAALGPAIASVPVAILQVIAGTLLLLFGLRWLRKAMLRYAGVIAMRDEEILFERSRGDFSACAGDLRPAALAALTVFKVVLLEGVEVIVIVIGIGAAGHMLVPASAGALAACLVVAAAGVLLHRPLARVPENALKLAVGTLVTAFGIFWFGEGVGIRWPAGEATILALVVALFVTSAAGVGLARRAAR